MWAHHRRICMNHRSEAVISNAIKELFEVMTVSAEENAKKKIKKYLDTVLVKEQISASWSDFLSFFPHQVL
jgi:hypothetical protein